MKMLVSAANESVGKACLPSEIKNFSNPKERILVICIKNLKKKKKCTYPLTQQLHLLEFVLRK